MSEARKEAKRDTTRAEVIGCCVVVFLLGATIFGVCSAGAYLVVKLMGV